MNRQDVLTFLDFPWQMCHGESMTKKRLRLLIAALILTFGTVAVTTETASAGNGFFWVSTAWAPTNHPCEEVTGNWSQSPGSSIVNVGMSEHGCSLTSQYGWAAPYLEIRMFDATTGRVLSWHKYATWPANHAELYASFQTPYGHNIALDFDQIFPDARWGPVTIVHRTLRFVSGTSRTW